MKISNDKVDLEEIIENNRKAIKTIDDKIEALSLKETELEKKTFTEKLKICRFFDKGYCKLKSRCKFVHSDQNCETYEKEGS